MIRVRGGVEEEQAGISAAACVAAILLSPVAGGNMELEFGREWFRHVCSCLVADAQLEAIILGREVVPP